MRTKKKRRRRQKEYNREKRMKSHTKCVKPCRDSPPPPSYVVFLCLTLSNITQRMMVRD